MITTRSTTSEWLMEVALATAKRGTCARRQVGCVLVNQRNEIMATGYNGVARGLPHCLTNHCPGAMMASGTGLDMCEATHAEANALLQCRDVSSIFACYVTTEPCVHCVKMLLNTGCEMVYYLDPYAGSGERLWVVRHSPRTWLQLPSRNYLSC